MGCAASAEDSTGGEATAGRTSSKMQKSVSAEETIKVVLLGPGESGKSTVLKQMKILEARDKKAQCWTPEELVASKVIVYSNAAGQMRLLAQLAIKFEVAFSNPEIAAEAKRFAEVPVDAFNPADPTTGEVLKRLWAEDALRVMYNERDHLYNLNDGAGYFWDQLDRIYAPDYVPTEADLLRVRLRTAMAEEVVFNYKGSPILVVDLGGQRQERRKWAEYIHDASTLLFVSSLCEWDQKLREETSTNRMDDTFALFEQVLHEVTQAEKTPNIVLLLNKMDLFTEKIRGGKSKDNFKTYFADYKGPLNPQQCADHVKGRFLALCKKSRTRVHAHLISALETDNVRLLWHGIRETLVEEALRGMI